MRGTTVADVRSALEACRQPLERARSLPPAVYTDPDVHAWEQRAVFDRGWVGVGRSDRWTPGSVAPVAIGDVSAIVSRDQDGRIHAMANSCRHRGAEVVLDADECARVRCGFHGWTYALDGRLVGAPHMQIAEDFDRADHGLVRFACEERYGFVFVSLEADPQPIDEAFAGFPELHAPWPLADLVTHRRREFTVDCNWKLFAEVFNEYYHLPYVHPDSIADAYPEPDPRDDAPGAFATQFGETSSTASLLEDARGGALPLMPGLTGREAAGVRYTWLFPTLVMALGVDCMWMYEVYPDGPDRCRCAQVVAFPAESMAEPDFEARARNYLDRHDLAIAEDIPALEAQHRGLRSPFAQQGPFSHLEPSVAHFADWYAGRMLAAD
ncbi:MAG: aromatic ring-hydroxylating dioxygenase subunit alpha [Actinomycetota bacterium]